MVLDVSLIRPGNLAVVKYNIIPGDVLGTGAFGKVYLAETEGFLVVDDTSSVSSRHRLAKRKDYRRNSAANSKTGTLRVAVKSLKGRPKFVDMQLGYRDLIMRWVPCCFHVATMASVVV